MSLAPFFFNSLPLYFKARDTNKDLEGKGVLERYISSIMDEAEEIKSTISGLENLVNPSTTTNEYITLLASLLGNPPATFRDNTFYRKLNTVIAWILYYRGTEKGFINFFSILGIQATLELLPSSEPTRFDDGKLFDDVNLYDSGKVFCRYYKTVLMDPESNVPVLGEDPIPGWAISNLLRIFEYLLPINAFLSEVDYNGEIILDPTIIIRKYSSLDTDIRTSANLVIRRI